MLPTDIGVASPLTSHQFQTCALEEAFLFTPRPNNKDVI